MYHEYKSAVEQIADAAKGVFRAEASDLIYDEVKDYAAKNSLSVLQHTDFLDLAEQKLGRSIFIEATSFEDLAKEFASCAMYYDCLEEYGHELLRDLQRAEQGRSVSTVRRDSLGGCPGGG